MLCKRIALVGMMGTGKSTIARHLAARLGVPCIDLDERIETRIEMKIPLYFKDYGEVAFRDLEHIQLESVTRSDFTGVLSTGGGIVNRKENRDLLVREWYCIHLVTDTRELVQRVLKDSTMERPMLRGTDDVESRLNQLWAERRSFYAEVSRLEVHTSFKSPAQIVEEILHFTAFSL
jgi:shikimate kinase